MQLREFLKEGIYERAEAAEKALLSMPTQNAIAELIALARDENPNVRSYAIIYSGKHFQTHAGELAVTLLSDSVAHVRWHACDTLHYLLYLPSSLLLYTIAVNDPDPIVRNRAVIALGKMGNLDMIPGLNAAAATEHGTDHEGSPIRDNIYSSISSIRERHLANSVKS